MNEPGSRGTRAPASGRAGREAAGPAGVVGIGLAVVLSFALAQGSWQWFATFIGVTLLAVILAFQGRPPWTPGIRTGYARNLVAYSLLVGLCVALALAPMLQRWAWLFPMSGTRGGCLEMGRYQALLTEAALADLAGRDGAALAYAQANQSGKAVADCLAATTTLWLPLYGAAAAVLVGAVAWFRDRARARQDPQPGSVPTGPPATGALRDGAT
ncbi:hypothetical protein ABZW32_34080 [Streptomyces sp. NPDC004667]|uniref:hypothetical protein n=1 Tax=Streptomyces sp. NPDC004667 TaxID=3154285 RepID=UPI0033A71B6C